MPDRRDSRPRWASILGVFLAAGTARGQAPAPPPPPQPPPTPREVPPRRVGPIRRALRHAAQAIHEDFIGDPDLFAEPPLGAYLVATNAVMLAKAEPHRFTLYRSDFLVDSTELSPSGAYRIGRIAAGLRCWLGPVIVEPTPDRPGLAEARRAAVIGLLAQAGGLVGPERVVIGPGVSAGLLGTEAANNSTVMTGRAQAAAAAYPLPPAPSPGGGAQGGR